MTTSGSGPGGTLAVARPALSIRSAPGHGPAVPRWVTACATLALWSLTGCASFSDDGGFTQVARWTEERTGVAPRPQRLPDEAKAVQARLDELLASPLSAPSAVEIALLNNQGLRARFDELGIAEAELVRAGRLHNPTVSFGRLRGGGVTETDRSVVVDLLGLLTLPLARQAEQARFEQVQRQAAWDAVTLAAEARRAYFAAVAAQQMLGYLAQVKEAADASNDLARRMAKAGNFSPLDHMREQAFYLDASAQYAKAQHQAVSTREQLIRALGLPGEAPAITLPERLPELPADTLSLADVQQRAMDQRLDVIMARRATDATAKSLGLTRATRFIRVLNAGYQDKRSSGDAMSSGYTVELELPIFDLGSGRMAQAEATYQQSLHRTADLVIRAGSEVRESYSAYRTAHSLARQYRDEVVPLRKRISEENLLRYNAMLASVFELLADAREQISAVASSVKALRDFWIADTQLQTAMTAGSP